MSASANVIKLALKIADSCARSDVECHCAPIGDPPNLQWDLNSADECDHEHLAEAMEYLELRGLVKRDAQRPHIVSFPEQLE